MKLKLSTALAAAGCALALAIGGAHAETVFDVSATFESTGSFACPGCMLGGTITIDTTSVTNPGIVSANVTISGETPSVGPFTIPFLGFPLGILQQVNILDAANLNNARLVHTSGRVHPGTEGAVTRNEWSKTTAKNARVGAWQRHLRLVRKGESLGGVDFYPGGSLLPCRPGWPPFQS
jgi:hypothetical protein